MGKERHSTRHRLQAAPSPASPYRALLGNEEIFERERWRSPCRKLLTTPDRERLPALTSGTPGSHTEGMSQYESDAFMVLVHIQSRTDCLSAEVS
jgi:hypothetical protein